MLAVRSGESVGIDAALEALWPTVDRARGLASLRTAISQIRTVLRQNCITRQYDRVKLDGVWVDTVAFRELASEQRGLVREERWDQVVIVAREADALYVDDISSHDPSAVALSEEREALRTVHLDVLLDAADAALKVRWYRDGVDFARRALTLDRYSERAFRALIAAHAGIGETQPALAAYEQCRKVLADDLGADPSPQTHAVYLAVLTEQPAVIFNSSFIGRYEEQAWLMDAVGRGLREQAGALVLVSGDPGVGKSALVDRAVTTAPVPIIRLSVSATESVHTVIRRHRANRPVIVVIEDFDRVTAVECGLIAQELHRDGCPIVVIGIGCDLRSGDDDSTLSALRTAGRFSQLNIGPLCREELTSLAAETLSGALGGELIDRLAAASGGHPGRALATMRDWLTRGLLVSTTSGLALMPSQERAAIAAGRPRELARVYERLSCRQVELLALAAVLGGRVRCSVISAVDQESSAESVDEVMRDLVDLSVLKLEEGDYTFRGPWARDDMLAWLRPAERRRLHRVVAELAPIDPAEKVRHWLMAGEPDQAYSAAMDAACAAIRAGDLERARGHLLSVRESCDQSGSDPIRRMTMLEMIGDVSAQLGRPHEARVAYRSASAVARTHDDVAVARISEKDAALNRRAVHRNNPPAELVAGSLAGPNSRFADGQSRNAATVGERIRRIGEVLISARQLQAARRSAERALELSEDSITRAYSTAAIHRADVLLGGAAAARPALESAWADAVDSGDLDAQTQVGVLLCLTAHDLGLPSLVPLWDKVARLPLESRTRAGWGWLTVRVLTERGEFSAATAQFRRSMPTGTDELNGLLTSAALAGLEKEMFGPTPRARQLFAGLLGSAAETGRTLVAPEAAAQLAEMTAEVDAAGAGEYLDSMDELAGEAMLGRERCARMLAVAAIRSALGNVEGAGEMARSAAQAADALGLVFLRCRALSAAARYLLAHGDVPAARWASGEQAGLLIHAGASVAARRCVEWQNNVFGGPVPQLHRVRPERTEEPIFGAEHELVLTSLGN